VRFEIEQMIRAPCHEVLEALGDPAFYDALAAMPNLGRPQLLERSDAGGRLHLKVRFSFTGELSPAVRAVVKPEKLTWVADTTIDRETCVVSFVVVPDHYPDRLSGSVTECLEDEDGITRRVTQGTVSVHVPFLGRSAEPALIRGFRHHLEAEAGLLEEWLTR